MSCTIAGGGSSGSATAVEAPDWFCAALTGPILPFPAQPRQGSGEWVQRGATQRERIGNLMGPGCVGYFSYQGDCEHYL